MVTLAVVISLVRYSLPYLNNQKHHVESWLSTQVGAQVKIGTISAKWQGNGPAIVLENLELVTKRTSAVQLAIQETAIEVDFWQSILAKQVRSNLFDLRNLQLTLDLDLMGQGQGDYQLVDALEKLFLQQLHLFSISDSRIILNTGDEQQVVLVDQVSWVNKDEHHQGVGQLQIEEIASNSASFILDLYGGKEDLEGTFYAKGEDVDLSPWLEQARVNSGELIEGRGSFVMWASIDRNALQSVQLDLSNSRVKWRTEEGEISAAILGGRLIAMPEQSDWLVNLNNLTTQFNDQVLVTQWAGKLDSQGGWQLASTDKFNVSPVMELLPLGLNSQQLQTLDMLSPEAQVETLQIVSSQKQGFIIESQLGNITWQQTSTLPGVENLQANVKWHNNGGLIAVKSKSGHLLVDKVLPDDLAYQRFYLDMYVQQQQDGWQLFFDNALFKSELVTVKPQGFFRSTDGFMSLSVDISDIAIADLSQLYPTHAMGEGTKRFLNRAVQGGDIAKAQVIWSGSLSQFPFEQNQGVFQAGLDLKNGQFKFAPDWPAVTDLDMALLFENQGLSFQTSHGQLMEVDILSLSAHLPRLTASSVLTIDAKGNAFGQQVTELIEQSSLADTLGKTLQQVQIKGPVDTDLTLQIPLTGKNIVASGQVHLNQNRILIPNLDFTLEQVVGVARFKNDQVEFEEITGNLLGQPVVTGFSGAQQPQGYQAKVNLGGNWDVSPLLADFYPNLSPYLIGRDAWQAEVDLTIPTQGFVYSAKVFTELLGVESSLPEPFNTSNGQPLPLTLLSQGNQQASSVKITLGNEVQFNGNLPHKDMQFSRAHLAVGESELMGMGLGFSVSANVAELDADLWYPVIDKIAGGDSESGKSLLSAPRRIFINADSAILASQRLSKLALVAKNTDEAWMLDVNAKEARMEVVLYKDWLNKGVNIDADFLNLARWEQRDNQGEQKGKGFTPELASLPPVNFTCRDCKLLGQDLGKIDVSLSKTNQGMRIEQARFKTEHGTLFAEGDWFLSGGQSSTRLAGEFTSGDFGAFLKEFELDSGIKDSKASSEFDLSWQHAPYEFNFESLNGQLNMYLSDGYLTEVTDKGSRIFSLLSLESLVRKLSLDFRDVFAKGFFYDQINGSFQIENGIASSQDILVDGGAGDIAMRGSTDLVAQQLNYQIDFTPKVTSSLPVIVAWMVNPATAIAALAIDQVLTSAKVISNIKFSLTGPFDEPKLEELGRDSKDIVLPARVQPTTEPDDVPMESDLIDPNRLPINSAPVSEGDVTNG